MKIIFRMVLICIGIANHVFASIDPLSEATLAVSGNILGRQIGRLLVESEMDYVQAYHDQRTQGKKHNKTREYSTALEVSWNVINKSQYILGKPSTKMWLTEVHGFAGTIILASARRVSFPEVNKGFSFINNTFSDIYALKASTSNPWDWLLTSVCIAAVCEGVSGASQYAHQTGWLKTDYLSGVSRLSYPLIGFGAAACMYKSLNSKSEIQTKEVLKTAATSAVVCGVGELIIDKTYEQGWIGEDTKWYSKAALQIGSVLWGSGYLKFTKWW